jgi:hypothetical protein
MRKTVLDLVMLAAAGVLVAGCDGLAPTTVEIHNETSRTLDGVAVGVREPLRQLEPIEPGQSVSVDWWFPPEGDMTLTYGWLAGPRTADLVYVGLLLDMDCEVRVRESEHLVRCVYGDVPAQWRRTTFAPAEPGADPVARTEVLQDSFGN